MQPTRIAVTGGSGRLGHYVVAELGAHADVTILDRAPPAAPRYAYAEVDILDLGAVFEALAGHDALVHLAAIDADRDLPDAVYFETNVQGTWNVLQAAHELGIRRAAIASSVSATGIGVDAPEIRPLYLPVDEAHPLRPTGPYGLSKQIDEVIAQSFARRGVTRIACLRPTLIVRDEVVAQVDHLARRAAGDPDAAADVNAAGRGERFPGPLPLLRSYVRPDDVARCFRLALEVEIAPFETFFVAAHDTIARLDSLAYVRELYGALPDIRKPELYAADPHAGLVDISHARATLGWAPTGTWTSYLAEAGG